MDLYRYSRSIVRCCFSYVLFKDTRLGLWCYSKFDATLDFLVERWGWTWLEQPEDAWRKRYPKITKKIDSLESEIQSIKREMRKG